MIFEHLLLTPMMSSCTGHSFAAGKLFLNARKCDENDVTEGCNFAQDNAVFDSVSETIYLVATGGANPSLGRQSSNAVELCDAGYGHLTPSTFATVLSFNTSRFSFPGVGWKS